MFEYLRHCQAPKIMTKIQSDFDMALCITKRPLKKKNLVVLSKKFQFTEDMPASLIGLSSASFKRMLSESLLSELANEMVTKLAELYNIGLITFDGDRISFVKWLDAHVPALGDYKPNQLIGTLTGTGIVKDLLLRMEYSIPE